MRILVYLRDGRTVYRIQGRGWLSYLVSKEPWHEGRAPVVDRGIWNPTTGEFVWTSDIEVRFLAKSSISHVEKDETPS